MQWLPPPPVDGPVNVPVKVLLPRSKELVGLTVAVVKVMFWNAAQVIFAAVVMASVAMPDVAEFSITTN